MTTTRSTGPLTSPASPRAQDAYLEDDDLERARGGAAVRRTVEDLGAEVERRWAQLGAPVEAGELKVIDLPQTVDAGTLLLGVAQDGSRLLVPLTADAHRSLQDRSQESGRPSPTSALGARRWQPLVPRRRLPPPGTSLAVLKLHCGRAPAIRAPPRCRSTRDRKDMLLRVASVVCGRRSADDREATCRSVRRASCPRTDAWAQPESCGTVERAAW